MKPIMNPPPVITEGIENTSTIAPHAFLFSGLIRSIIAANNTRAPHINAMTAIVANGTAAMLSAPGSVGKTQGKYDPATPTATALETIKSLAIRDNVRALFGFSLWLIYSHFLFSFQGYHIQFKQYALHPTTSFIQFLESFLPSSSAQASALAKSILL